MMEINEIYKPDVKPFAANVFDTVLTGTFDANKINMWHLYGPAEIIGDRMVAIIKDCVIEWNLTLGDQMYPLTTGHIWMLPKSILFPVIEAIMGALINQPPACMRGIQEL